MSSNKEVGEGEGYAEPGLKLGKGRLSASLWQLLLGRDSKMVGGGEDRLKAGGGRRKTQKGWVANIEFGGGLEATGRPHSWIGASIKNGEERKSGAKWGNIRGEVEGRDRRFKEFAEGKSPVTGGQTGSGEGKN